MAKYIGKKPTLKETPYGSLSRWLSRYLAKGEGRKRRAAIRSNEKGPVQKGKLSKSKVGEDRLKEIAEQDAAKAKKSPAPKTLAGKKGQPTVGTIPHKRVEASEHKAGYKARKAALAKQNAEKAKTKAAKTEAAEDRKADRKPKRPQTKRRYGLMGRRAKKGFDFSKAIRRHLGSR